MTLFDYLRVLRERWAIVLTTIVVGVAGAGAFWFLRPPEYTATVRMYVAAQVADTTQAAYQGAQLSQQRVTSYVELVSSTRVSEEVVRRLRLDTDPEDLARDIVATSKLDSVIIDVAVTGKSPTDVEAVANAVGAVFPKLVDELERPSSPTGTPPVVVRVVQPAAVPDEPSSIPLLATLGLGVLAGVALGVAAAVARNALDTSVRDPEQLRRLSGVPNLGTIAFDAEIPKRPLTVQEDPQSPRAEAFRQLRTNLQFIDIDHPQKVIVFTSSMPAEGKTTTVSNLAIALAAAGNQVITIEADLRRPKLADLLGLDRSVGLTSVLAGKARLEQAVQHWSGGVFDVLASGPLPPNPSELLASRNMAVLLHELRDRYDVVLIDTPPILPVTDAAALAPATDGVILVSRYKEARKPQVESAVESLRAVSARLLGTVLTMVPTSGPGAYARYNSYYQAHGAAASNGHSIVKPVIPAVSPVKRPISGSMKPSTGTIGPSHRNQLKR